MNDVVYEENSNSSCGTLHENIDYSSEEEYPDESVWKTRTLVDSSSNDESEGSGREIPHAGSSVYHHSERDRGHVEKGRLIYDVLQTDDDSDDDFNPMPSKKRCKNNSVDKTNPKRHSETPDVNCKLGEYVTKEYELLRLILSYLPNKDLKSASKVCRSWMSVANIINKSRTKLDCLFWRHRVTGHSQSTFLRRMFRENVYIEPKFSLAFVGQKSHSLVPNMPSSPQCCFFGSGTVQTLWNHLEADSKLICIQGHGVVGTTHNKARTLEIENNHPSLSMLMLPGIPGVNVTSFQLDESQCLLLSQVDCLSDDKLKQLTGISLSEPIRCLLLFCTMKTSSKTILTLVNSIQSRQDIEMAVGGGIMESCCYIVNKEPAFHPDSKMGRFIVGVAFSGPNVSATSTVLNESVKQESQIGQVFDKFKVIQEPNCYQSIGLMFACLGRGLYWYSNYHVESKMFQRSFPDTPIIGYFGNGEIGVDCCSERKVKKSGCKTPQDKYRATRKSLIHTYTTVFVRLCFKNARV